MLKLFGNKKNKTEAVEIKTNKTKSDIIDEKKKIAEANEKHIQNVMEKTGWSHEVAVTKIKDARKRLGIKYREYSKYEMYNIPVEEQEEYYKKAIEKAQKKKEDKEKHIASVMKKTGWTKEETIGYIEEAKKKLGIKYKEYDKYDFHLIAKEDQEKCYQDILEQKKEKKEKKEKKKEKFINTVIDSTGWDYETAVKNMDKAKELCGAEYKDYVAYKFWTLDDDVKKTYFTKGHANTLREKYNTNKDNVSCFMNKNEFNEVFTSCLGRPWAYNKKISLDEFKDIFKDESKIIYKPLSASCGSGVTAFEINEENVEAVYQELKELPIGVVEGYIIQHPEMSKYSKKSVNTIRMVTVRKDDEVNMLYAAFRMGGGDAIVDNFHSGGVLALIDVENGVVVTNAIDLSANVYENHPATGEKIKGFQIPYWKETIEMIKTAGLIVEGIGYVGWDIAITEKGPVLIEGNTAPAPNVLQLPYALEGKGMFHVVEKYL